MFQSDDFLEIGSAALIKQSWISYDKFTIANMFDVFKRNRDQLQKKGSNSGKT